MKRLTKIRLINWHYFANETIEVTNNVLLTGQNATGKSTILDAITFVITAGDTQFNMAANENGKRDLKGYVKCKVSRSDKEYLREGDVSSHIALEFYDEKADEYFTVGTVIDAFGDLLPAKVIFYQVFNRLSDSFFVSDEGTILGTLEFKKHNKNFDIFLTRKEAKRAFRTTFGNLKDDFFRLIHKALAFKPISDVKEFIYDHLLEEKQIDVENIKDSIRAYKELENTLKIIKEKINELHEIEAVYKDIDDNAKNRDFYEYVLKLFDEKALKVEIDELRVKETQINELYNQKALEIKAIESEIDSLDERSKEIYNLLASDDGFKQNEYLDKQIIKATTAIKELENSEEAYLVRASKLKDTVREMRKVNDSIALKKLANLSLNNVSEELIESTKLSLIDILNTLKNEYDEVLKNRNDFEHEKQTIVNEINVISNKLHGLENRKLCYNPQVTALKSEIEAGLKDLYNYDVSCYVLSELLEITDSAWADTIEVYLNNRRFNLIVEPRYYDQALQIYNRVKNARGIYGVGLVNTKKLNTYNSHDPKSLASIIKSENIDAMRYINYICGNVIMCNDVSELENYRSAITNEGMVYQGYVSSALNYNRVERPFIGRDATDKQLQVLQKEAAQKKLEYMEISKTIDYYTNLAKNYQNLDLKMIIDNLDISSRLNKVRTNLESLKEQKRHQVVKTSSELQDDYDKILETIKNYNQKKENILETRGTYKAEVNQVLTSIREKEDALVAISESLKDLKLSKISLEKAATDELNRCFSISKDVKKHRDDYLAKVSKINEVIQNLLSRLTHLQYLYNSKYNTPYGVGLTEMKVFVRELEKLEKSEIITYEQKVRSAREDAELLFREDFLSKLRNYIMSAEDEIKKINDTLKTITFGDDSYEFVFPKSKEFAIFYDMVTSDFENTTSGLLTLDFEMKYNEQLEELFTSLTQDELNSNGAINKFTDYRTYMDYDIKIIDHRHNSETYYSEVFKEKSGGETQVPFYVAIIASFVRVYTKNNRASGDTLGLVLFDEVFDKMDDRRMKAMMQFINSMPIQIILACPSSRLKDLAPYTETIIVTLRDGEKAQIANVLSKDVINDVNI